jgi:hypothetical protein
VRLPPSAGFTMITSGVRPTELRRRR